MCVVYLIKTIEFRPIGGTLPKLHKLLVYCQRMLSLGCDFYKICNKGQLVCFSLIYFINIFTKKTHILLT